VLNVQILTGKYDRLWITGFALLSNRVQNYLVQLGVQRRASHAGQRHRIADVFVRIHAQQNGTDVGLKNKNQTATRQNKVCEFVRRGTEAFSANIAPIFKYDRIVVRDQ